MACMRPPTNPLQINAKKNKADSTCGMTSKFVSGLYMHVHTNACICTNVHMLTDMSICGTLARGCGSGWWCWRFCFGLTFRSYRAHNLRHWIISTEHSVLPKDILQGLQVHAHLPMRVLVLHTLMCHGPCLLPAVGTEDEYSSFSVLEWLTVLLRCDWKKIHQFKNIGFFQMLQQGKKIIFPSL